MRRVEQTQPVRLPSRRYDRDQPLAMPGLLEGLSARVFPLRSSVAAQQALCDAFMHQTLPAEVARFRPVGPYVYLMVVDYGRLTAPYRNLGWFAQREILFTFPVHWYRVVDGRWIFQDWAVLTPYIFVDDDLSVPLGRRVYGWGKAAARLTPHLSRWLDDPRSPVRHASASTMVFPELYEGRRLRSETFLEIERDGPFAFGTLPPNPDSAFAPWTAARNVARTLTALGRDSFSWLAGSGVFPAHPGGSPENLGEMLVRMTRLFSPDGNGLVANTLNLKQFRRADRQDLICYQALTNARMRVVAFNAAGPLGSSRVLFGDASGGYLVRLHEWPSLRIAESLGLHVHRSWQGHGRPIVELKPLFPFWYDVDQQYGPGENVAYRHLDDPWRRSPTDPVRLEEGEPARGLPYYNTAVSSSPDPVVGPFEFTGTTIRVLPLLADKSKLECFLKRFFGDPYRDDVDCKKLPDASMPGVRFVPWAQPGPQADDAGESGGPKGAAGGAAEAGADPEGVCQEGQEPVAFEQGYDDSLAYVYLTALSFGEVVSPKNDVGDWAKYEVSFLIPVMCQVRTGPGEDDWETKGVGLVPAYSFVDHTTAEIARGEILGMQAQRAEFVRPDSAWISEDEPLVEGRQVLLRLDSEVLPAVGEGQSTLRSTVLEIREERGDSATDDVRTWWDVEEWVAHLIDEVERKKVTRFSCETDAAYKTARALALHTLGLDPRFAYYTKKEFRDAANPEQACYEALIRFTRSLEQILDVREIETLISVRIRDFPTHPIVRSLGIRAALVTEDARGTLFETQAVRPFFLSVAMNESLGERLFWKGDGDWEYEGGLEEVFAPDVGAGHARPPADVFVSTDADGPMLGGERVPDLGDPRNLRHFRSLARRYVRAVAAAGSADPPPETIVVGDDTVRRVDLEEALKALEVIEPQILIECILSREWGSRSPTARWLKGRKELREHYRDAVSGVTTAGLPAVERHFFEKAYAQLTDPGLARPGQVPVRDVEAMIEQYKRFAEARKSLADEWSGVANFLVRRERGDIVHEPSAPDHWRLKDSIPRLLGRLNVILAMDFMGWPTAPQDWSAFRGAHLRHLRRKLRRIRCESEGLRAIELAVGRYLVAFGLDPEDKEKKELPKSLTAGQATAARDLESATYDRRDQLRDAVHLASAICSLQREALFIKLSKKEQKPDFCVLRAAAGKNRDELLPIDDSWNDEWYFGQVIQTCKERSGEG